MTQQQYTPVSWQDETTSQQGTLINAERLNQMQTAHHFADGLEETDTVPTADPGVDYHKVVYCTADNTLYRWDGTQWTADIDDPTRELLEEHLADHDNPHQVTKAQVGLGNADNTSDLDKPISTATQTALNAKADKATTYTKSETDTLLGAKADKSDTYTKAEVDTALATKADQATTYTKTEADTLLGAKADQATTYTKSEVQTYVSNALDGYLPMVRTSGNQTISGVKSFSNFITGMLNYNRYVGSGTNGGKWVRVGSLARNTLHFHGRVYSTYGVVDFTTSMATLIYSYHAATGTAFEMAMVHEADNTYTIWWRHPGNYQTAYFCDVSANRYGGGAPDYFTPSANDTAEDAPVVGAGASLVTATVIDAPSTFVHTSGDETIQGVKTFTSSAFTSINIKSARTTDNIGGLNFISGANATVGQIYGRLSNSNSGAVISATHSGVIRRFSFSNTGTNAFLSIDDNLPYDPANTNNVATIGTLDAYTPMVRTTGNQAVYGDKTHINGLMGQSLVGNVPASGTYYFEVSFTGNTTQFAKVEICDYINNTSTIAYDFLMAWNGSAANAKVYARHLGPTLPAQYTPKFTIDNGVLKLIYPGLNYHSVFVNVTNARSWINSMTVTIERKQDPDYSGLTLQDVIE